MDPRLRHELRLLEELGYTHLDLTPRMSAGGETPAAPVLAPDDPIALLSSEIGACTACRLCETRTNVVVGSGNPDADLMFIGEAPGRDEDLAGEPFVGRAGQLLTDIIRAIKFERDEVYIANIIKCRPPQNRNPEPDEMDACRPFLLRQIEIVKPRVIVTLGRFAFQSTMQTTSPISSVRGVWHELEGIRLMPTYHPAYLLRNPSAKRDVWNDMKKVMAELDKSPS